MDTTSSVGDPDADDRLDLPACPICHNPRPLSRQETSMAGGEYVWYECETCRSALLSLHGGQWAFQKITRPGHEGLLRKPMTLSVLHRLLPEPLRPQPAGDSFLQERPPATRPARPPVTPRVEAAPPDAETWRRVEQAPRTPEPFARTAAAAARPAPAPPAEREAGSIEALRATLRTEEEAPPRPAAEVAEESAGASLPFPFVAAVITLIVLLVAGLFLIALVGWWPT